MAMRTRKNNKLDKFSAISALFARYNEPLPMGDNWHPVHCISPKHHDENRSASVNPAAGAYVCHACGIRGDAFAVLQQIEHVDFVSSLHILQDRSASQRTTQGSRFDWL